MHYGGVACLLIASSAFSDLSVLATPSPFPRPLLSPHLGISRYHVKHCPVISSFSLAVYILAQALYDITQS
uniref:Uncharacterized protein n=1 Tax=Salix viminalis TaxID=40686 RepID=A0A6N2MER1_SALVM